MRQDRGRTVQGCELAALYVKLQQERRGQVPARGECIERGHRHPNLAGMQLVVALPILIVAGARAGPIGMNAYGQLDVAFAVAGRADEIMAAKYLGDSGEGGFVDGLCIDVDQRRAAEERLVDNRELAIRATDVDHRPIAQSEGKQCPQGSRVRPSRFTQ